MMNAQLSHVAFYIKDLEKSLSFYRLLGFEYAYDLRKDDGSIWLVYLHNQSHQFVELFPVADRQPEAKKTGFFHFCLTVDDIEAFGRHLQENGITLYNGAPFRNHVISGEFVPVRIACGSYAFFIQDPDNNYIEVMQYTKDSLQKKY